MAILSTAYNRHHVIHLSDVFDPFPDMVSRIGNIVHGKSSTLRIDEEGVYSYLTAWILDDDCFELIVETDYYDDEEKEGIDVAFVETKILAVVNQKDFVREFYRRFQDFLLHDYSWFGWNNMDPEDCSEEERAAADLRNTGLSVIRKHFFGIQKTRTNTLN